ncbi:MAG: hypothetical protein ACOZF0_19420 [Thermodesulfobacteriota bacterium]
MKRSLLWGICIGVLCLRCAGVPTSGVADRRQKYMELSVSFNTKEYPWILGTKYPQMAIWVESATDPARTVFATEMGAKNSWHFASERPSSLPVWYGVVEKETDLNIDAVSGATPSGEVHTFLWQIPEQLHGKTISLYVEANVSFDYNQYYNKDESTPGFSDVNGQPSMVWKAVFTADDRSREITPEIAGHGHVLGEDHRIDPDLSQITTARELFHYIHLQYAAGR